MYNDLVYLKITSKYLPPHSLQIDGKKKNNATKSNFHPGLEVQ